MTLRETAYFLSQFRRSVASVGAIFPTSRAAARAMASEFARRAGPRRVLEVGPGTGAITAEIVRAMGPDDELLLCELNPDFVAYLRRRLDEEPLFRARRGQITLLHADVTELGDDQRFDIIISAIPFTNCPPAIVERIFAYYQRVLAPDGVLSFIEYAYLRALKRHLLTPAARAQAEAVSAVVDRWVEPHCFRRDLVVANVPPAWVRHLRFQPPTPTAAAALAPLTHTRRLALGGEVGLSTEALPFLVGLLGAAWLARGWRGASAALALLATAVAAFFRDPARPVQPDPDAALAASDGRVLAVEEVHDARFGPGLWLRVAVFLSITDVHINRSPVAGVVTQQLDEAGGYAIASHPHAAHNRTRYTVIEGAHGPCVVAQRVGAVARRIVSWAQPGEALAQGDRFGLIRFGSRTDVYLPATTFVPCVHVGERVVGGVTVLARQRAAEAPSG